MHLTSTTAPSSKIPSIIALKHTLHYSMLVFYILYKMALSDHSYFVHWRALISLVPQKIKMSPC